MKQGTQTSQEFSVNLLRQLAFLQFNDEPYFFCDGKFYEGSEDKARKDFKDSMYSQDETFEQWVEDNCTEVTDFDNDDYYVLTDEEADEKTKEYIEESVWAFTPSFLASETKVPQEMFEALQANGKCESNNDAILNCIEDIDEFTKAAISADGRGHFLSSYDGCENEETVKGYINEETGDDSTTFYIYRMN